MKATDVIRGSLDGAKMWFMALMDDVKSSPMTAPTANGGNHPLWILGHIVYSEAGMLAGYIQGVTNPLSKWDKLFGKGSSPMPDASKYPSVEELLAEFEKVRANTLKVLGTMSDDDLSKSSKAPADRAAIFGTIGQCFSMMSMHMIFHAGQIADARKAMGKAPLFG